MQWKIYIYSWISKSYTWVMKCPPVWWFYLAFSAVGDEVPLFCCVCSGMEMNELVLGSNMIDGYSNCPKNIEFTWSKF